MRKSHPFLRGPVLLMIVLAACGPKPTPTAEVTEPPATEAATEVATATEPATEVPATETLVPLNLVGPEMAIGETWLYVDLSYLVAVPGGPFLMGRGGGTDNPEHEVTVSDFWIYQMEVTNSQYAFCLSQGICSSPNLDENPTFLNPLRAGDPVTGVDWDQARTYCEWVHGRLPTEAEWEKAAAWDPTNAIKNIYPWGDAAPTCALTNYNNCVGKTTNVAQYPAGASPYLLLGGAGNAFEWVADIFDPLYYSVSPAEDPQGPEDGTRRSIRSGGYKSNKDQMPSAVRFFDSPDAQRRDLGFRCVVEDPTFFAPWCELVPQVGTPGPNGGLDGVDIPVESCPSVDVTIGETCDGGGTTYVTFTGSPVTDDVGGAVCIEAPPNVHSCTTGGVATGKWDCTVPPPPAAPGCPVNYTKVGDTCIPDAGTDGECLPGSNYDPATQCCTASPGADGSPFDLCPAGTYFSNADHACVPWPVQGQIQIVKPFGIKTCGGGQNGCPTSDPNYPNCDQGCEDDPPTCEYPKVPQGCSCVCPPNYPYCTN